MRKFPLVPVLLILIFSIFSCDKDSSVGRFSGLSKDGSGNAGEITQLSAGSLVRKGEGPSADPGILREPFDLGTSTVNYFSAGDLDGGTLDIEDDGRPLTVEDFGPEGTLPRENRKPVVYVSFSHAMVPLSRLGAPLKEFASMTVSPELTGTWRWYGTRTLSFEPDQPLRSQQQYTVTVSGRISSLGKKKLENDFTFSFETEALDIADMRPGTFDEVWTEMNNVPPTHSGSILLSFTEPVDIDYIKTFISVNAGGREFPYSISRPSSEETELDDNYISRTVQLTLGEELPADSEVQLILEKGAASEQGYNGTGERLIRRFHTLVPFRYEKKSTYSHAFPRSRTGTINPVFLTLSQPVKAEGAAGYISTSFGELEDWESRVEIWNNIIRINDLPVEYGRDYEIRLRAGLSDVYGQSLAADELVTVNVPEAAAYAMFPGGSVYNASDYNHRMLEAQFQPRIIYEYQNIDAGSLAVASVPGLYDHRAGIEPAALDLSEKKRNEANYEIMDLSPWLNGGYGAVQLNWNLENPRTGKYVRDYTQNLVVQVTDIGLTMRYAYNRIIVWANSLSTGNPIADAEVVIDLGGSRRSLKTDQNGLAVFELTGNENKSVFSYRYHSRFNKPVTVTVNGDRADFLPAGTHSPYRFGVYSGAGPYSGNDADPVSFFFTDRGLYKPGEKLSFRGIDRDLKLGEFSAYEGGYDIEVKEQKWRANAFISINGNTTSEGGFHGEIELPSDLKPGAYELRYKRTSQNRFQSVIFQVKNFRRLNFQLTSDVPDRLY